MSSRVDIHLKGTNENNQAVTHRGRCNMENSQTTFDHDRHPAMIYVIVTKEVYFVNDVIIYVSGGVCLEVLLLNVVVVLFTQR